MKKQLTSVDELEKQLAAWDTHMNVMISLKKLYAECSKAGISMLPVLKLLSTIYASATAMREHQHTLKEELSTPQLHLKTINSLQQTEWQAWLIETIASDSLALFQGRERNESQNSTT